MVELATGRVRNVIAWDGVSPFRDDDGCFSHECDAYVQKGDTHNGVTGAFLKQYDAPKPPAPTVDERAARKVDSLDRLQFEVLFNHENRIRALEGKASITAAQFRDALIARWKEITS